MVSNIDWCGFYARFWVPLGSAIILFPFILRHSSTSPGSDKRNRKSSFRVVHKRKRNFQGSHYNMFQISPSAGKIWKASECRRRAKIYTLKPLNFQNSNRIRPTKQFAYPALKHTTIKPAILSFDWNVPFSLFYKPIVFLLKMLIAFL